MKEVKEVVHVPTRELAEEVLRVAKDNGLMEILDINDWEYYKTETYFRPDEYGGFSNLSFAKTNGCTIITAQEFLNRYKPKFKPIAMRCTQEQFDAIKSKLAGCCLVGVSNFTKNIYLVNNFLGAKLNISNVIKPDSNDRQVFKEWNEKIFLEYCGISIGIEDSHKDVHVKGCWDTDKYELDQLRKENAELKEQLKAIEDQPKVGDVCLFWDEGDNSFVVSNLRDIDTPSSFTYETMDGVWYENCIKATDENIKAKIKELQND